jgi:hypothetical protein
MKRKQIYRGTVFELLGKVGFRVMRRDGTIESPASDSDGIESNLAYMKAKKLLYG